MGGKNEFEKVFQIVAILLAIFTPYAYLLGASFYQGYMNGWGVTAESFPISTADTYVYAYYFIGYIMVGMANEFIDVLKMAWALPLIVFFILITLIIHFLIKVGKSTRIKQKTRRLGSSIKGFWVNHDLTKALTFTGILYYLIVSVVTFVSSIALLWWVLPVLAEQRGTAIALERVGEFQRKGCEFDKKTKWNKCVIVSDKDGNVLYKGVWIAKNNAELAIHLKDGSRILKLKDDYVVSKNLTIK